MNLKKSATSVAISLALGASAFVPQVASAGVATYSWDGVFTMLDAAGAALGNTSITAKGANTFQTAISGTMAFDTITGAGTATLVPFDFFAGSLPAEAVGINMQAIGDGAGGPGTLVLGNMLFNWNGTAGIPVSLVLDASGFFAATPADFGDGVLTQAEVAATGATPAVDGTYTNAIFGYLGVGPAIMATTDWNTSLGAGCAIGACQGVAVNGVLPKLQDTTSNGNRYDLSTPTTGDLLDATAIGGGPGQGIGGNPMASGPFQGFSANFDVTQLTATGFDPNASIAPFCEFDPSGGLCGTNPVPIPAAVWLFGSGLIGLVGVARRKKQA